jgi:hypothetical protein
MELHIIAGSFAGGAAEKCDILRQAVLRAACNWLIGLRKWKLETNSLSDSCNKTGHYIYFHDQVRPAGQTKLS